MMRIFRIAAIIILPVLLFSFSAAAQKSGSFKNDSHIDIKFPEMAYSGGLMEVQLGRLAQKNASSYKVKEFGERMIIDHSKANEELMKIARENNIQLPENMLSNNQKTFDELVKYKGSDFDKHYMNKIVEDHKEDITTFEDASKNEENADIRQWAQKTLPELRQHLKLAENTLNGLNNNK